MGSESRSRRFSGREQMPAARLEWPRGNLKFRAGTLGHPGESRGRDADFFLQIDFSRILVWAFGRVGVSASLGMDERDWRIPIEPRSKFHGTSLPLPNADMPPRPHADTMVVLDLID
jgi:hypothetical protein